MHPLTNAMWSGRFHCFFIYDTTVGILQLAESDSTPVSKGQAIFDLLDKHGIKEIFNLKNRTLSGIDTSLSVAYNK
jgi:hypothetical protein